jgi:hypothetical protein
LDSENRRKVYFVIDDDEEDAPSRIFHALISDEMLQGDAGGSFDALHHRM